MQPQAAPKVCEVPCGVKLAAFMSLICVVELESSTNSSWVARRAGGPGMKHAVEVNVENYPAQIKKECSWWPRLADIRAVHVYDSRIGA